MTQFYSRNDVNYNGDVYSIPFPYMKEEEIQVYLDDVLFTDWFFLQDTQLRLRSIPAGTTPDTIVSVRRVTNIDNKVVTYTNNTLLNKENLNLSQDQLLFAVQELYDNNTQFQIDTAEVIETNKQELLDIQEAFEQETQQQLLQNKTEIENRVTQFENEVNNTIDEVKEAANKVNQLEEAVDTAVTAANTATEQAEIAINKTDETTELVEQFTENIDSKISTNNENMQSVLAETEAVLQEAKDTLDDTLNKSQITNCLLEVPQNIKLELNDGVLTLKAGSKVIVPNGAGVFEEVEITSDKELTLSWGTPNDEMQLFLEVSSDKLSRLSLERIVSGGTDSYTGAISHIWYNTTTNKVNWINNDGSLGIQLSLPIANITMLGDGTSKVTSIDQVFNGMGYIGSTVWVDKGVKGLKPNGRNEDGSLNNTEIITTGVKTRTLSTTGSGDWYVAFNPNITWTNIEGYSYDEEKNMTLTGGTNWGVCVLGRMQFTNGVITSFQPKLPFRAVDSNDFNKTPHIIDAYINGESWYRVYSDGWCEQGGRGWDPTFLKTFKDTNYTIMAIGYVYVYAVAIKTKSTTGCTFYQWQTGNSAGNTTPVTWYACGFIS